ncbi:MAG TPA: hypothetical protein VGN23_12730 [Verrucomicrobiae bacterium]
MATKLIGLVSGGYAVALVSKRAQVTHVLILTVILGGISILENFSKPGHGNWPLWISGEFASSIYLTWGALFRKWRLSKSLKEEQEKHKSFSLPRSVFAIVVGFFVYMFYGVLSGAFWGQNFWPWPINEAIILSGVTVTNLVAGYLTAYISGKAELLHVFIMSTLCLVTPIVMRMFTGFHGDWGRWLVGALTLIICMTWSGFLRILQLRYRGACKPTVPSREQMI